MKTLARVMSPSTFISSPSWPSCLAAAAFVIPHHRHNTLMKPTITRSLTSSASASSTSSLVSTVTFDNLNMLQFRSFRLKSSVSDDVPSLTSSSAGSELDPDEFLPMLQEELDNINRNIVVDEKSLRSTLVRLCLSFTPTISLSSS